MSAPLVSIVWIQFIFNLLLQFLDGVLTYYVLSLGVPEANPLIAYSLLQLGAALGLFSWKALACALLAVLFALRHTRRDLTVKAFKLTATVYVCVTTLILGHLLFQIEI